MWKRSLAFCLGLGLLLSQSLYSFSPGEECEPLLEECATLLEIATNDLESLSNLLIEYKELSAEQRSTIGIYRSLTSDLSVTLRERDERLIRVESSFNDYVRGETINNIKRAVLIGAGALVLGFAGGFAVGFSL